MLDSFDPVERREILKTTELKNAEAMITTMDTEISIPMDTEISIPEEFVDPLVNEFAYDPIRLPVTEDAAQVLYNRRTLEKIWDTKNSAVNPYTRQPFHISNAIPQIQLRQQMLQYIENNRSLCQSMGFRVIPDYTKILSERQMEDLLKNLISNFKYLYFTIACNSEKRSKHPDLPRYWNALYRDLNLLRLYCQYHEENRDLFLSIKGYDYLFQVFNYESLYHLLLFVSTPYDDSKEVCTELVKIVDVIGLEDHHLIQAGPHCVWSFVKILHHVAKDEYSKIQSRVLKCYGGNIDWFLQNFNGASFYHIISVTIDLLAKRSYSDITNEDLYYGMTILKTAWIKNYLRVVEFEDYVNAIVDGVIICISRFQEMHAVDVETQGSCSSKRARRHEVKNNIYLLRTALGHALFLIDCLSTADDEDARDLIESKERLRSLDIVKDILQMVELVLAGFKFLKSSHLQLGLNITTTLYMEDGFSVWRRNEVVKSLGAFLRSDKVDMFNYKVKGLLLCLVEADSS